MLDMIDPGFKLFGKNIQSSPKDKEMYPRAYEAGSDFNDDGDCDYECISSNDSSKQDEHRGQYEKTSIKEPENTKQEGEKPPQNKRRSPSTITEDVKTTSNDKENSSQDSHNKDVSDQSSSTSPQHQKPLKNLGKILPCLRCNSMSTKFCYFNNYVSQPRHLCKGCQRYCTAGGATRSLPVGSGRWKSKNSSDKSYGFVQENGVIFQGLPSQVPYILHQVPWQSGFPMSFYSASTSTSLNSALSRKHSRDGTALFFGQSDCDSRNATEEKKAEKERVVIRKTLIVNDPIEAANSSMRTTLQIKKNNHHVHTPTAKRGFVGGVQVQQYNGNGDHERRHNNLSFEASSMVMEFNPAAFSRSLSFHEIAR